MNNQNPASGYELRTGDNVPAPPLDTDSAQPRVDDERGGITSHPVQQAPEDEIPSSLPARPGETPGSQPFLAPPPETSEFAQAIQALGLLPKFIPRPITETPAAQEIVIDWQIISNNLYTYFTWRIVGIATSPQANIFLALNVTDTARRLTHLSLNAILAKVVEIHRERGITNAQIANTVPPPPGMKLPQLTAYIVDAIGTVTPAYSANVTYVPRHTQGTSPDPAAITIGPANNQSILTPGFDPAIDSIIDNLYKEKLIFGRSVEWNKTSGTPAWLCGSSDHQSLDVYSYPPSVVDVQNYDPATTVLSHLCRVRALDLADAKYFILRPISRLSYYDLVREVFDNQNS